MHFLLLFSFVNPKLNFQTNITQFVVFVLFRLSALTFSAGEFLRKERNYKRLKSSLNIRWFSTFFLFPRISIRVLFSFLFFNVSECLKDAKTKAAGRKWRYIFVQFEKTRGPVWRTEKCLKIYKKIHKKYTKLTVNLIIFTIIVNTVAWFLQSCSCFILKNLVQHKKCNA